MAEQADGSPPHVLLFPFPIQGHMPPMLKLAQLLSSSSSSANFFVTFVNTHYSHRRFLRHSPALHLLGRHHPNLWQEDRDCMAWLDSQPPRSVVYVSFGSIAVVSREQATELLHGLLDSDHKFLWVVRQDMVLPPELRMGAGERGCLASWAPQEEVLAHPAVGCFLTHSGWNSTLESIVAGVPVICWPFMTDQQVNSRFTSEVWRIGVDMKDESSRNVVEKMVRDVMTGEEAEELRTTAGAMAAKAKASVEEGGSSYLNLMKLIHHIKDLSSKCSPDPEDSRDP